MVKTAAKTTTKTTAKKVRKTATVPVGLPADTVVRVEGGVIPGRETTLEAPADFTHARVNTDGARRAVQ